MMILIIAITNPLLMKMDLFTFFFSFLSGGGGGGKRNKNSMVKWNRRRLGGR